MRTTRFSFSSPTPPRARGLLAPLLPALPPQAHLPLTSRFLVHPLTPAQLLLHRCLRLLRLRRRCPLLSHILSAPASPFSPSPSPSATASCPAPISVPRDRLTSSSNGRGMTVELPCGIGVGSHVMVVTRPRAARPERDPRVAEGREGEAPVMVSQFMLELLGTKAVQGEEPPRILHFNPRILRRI